MTWKISEVFISVRSTGPCSSICALFVCLNYIYRMLLLLALS